MNKAYLLACLLMCCSSHQSEKGRALKIGQARWLAGVWTFESNGKQTYEMWQQLNDSTYTGKSYSLVDGDTTTYEDVRLLERDGEIAYIPIVVDQNAGKPVTFKLTFINPGKLVFENPSHDFPQIISYEKISNDSLLAQISGTVKEEQRVRIYSMQRMK